MQYYFYLVSLSILNDKIAKKFLAFINTQC